MSATPVSPLSDWKREAITTELAKMKNNHFVVLDIETTGLSPAKGARIIEIGAVRILNGVETETFQSFVDPHLKYGVPPKITSLTNITTAMVTGQPSIGQVLLDLFHFIGDAIVVCHNASFDWKRFLLPAFESIGIQMTNRFICTYEMFKKAAPKRGKGGYNLLSLCSLFDIAIGSHHRADDDALATAKAFLRIQQELVNVEEIEAQEYQESVVEHTPVEVRRVKFWEKRITKDSMMRRHYISLRHEDDFGTVYLDLAEKAWYNKDFPKPLDFKIVENDVLDFLSLENQQALLSYRN